MQLRIKKLALVAMILMLGPMVANALPISLDFEGTITGDINSNFASLVSVGDAVSGSIQFDFSPPPATDIAKPIIGGSFTVPSGEVSGFDYHGGGYSETIAGWGFSWGSGPYIETTDYRHELIGIAFNINVNGSNAVLDDYLDLDASDFFAVSIQGSTVPLSGGIYTGGKIANVELTSASFRVLVPDASIMLLLGTALVGLVGLGKKSFPRKNDRFPKH